MEKRNQDFDKIFKRLVMRVTDDDSDDSDSFGSGGGICMGKSAVKTSKVVTPVIKKNMVAAVSDSLDRRSSDEVYNYNLSADAVIWLGDFNYRVNGVISAVVHAM